MSLKCNLAWFIMLAPHWLFSVLTRPDRHLAVLRFYLIPAIPRSLPSPGLRVGPCLSLRLLWTPQ